MLIQGIPSSHGFDSHEFATHGIFRGHVNIGYLATIGKVLDLMRAKSSLKIMKMPDFRPSMIKLGKIT